jgi:hypothetical protein
MVALEKRFGPFGEVGVSNLEHGLDDKSRDNKYLEKELQKEIEKEKQSSSVINSSQSLFKMEAKVDMRPYQGDIDVIVQSLVVIVRSLF